ncbi:PucR family transcriptional regulator [Nocardia gamkensis]|uniref:PucR family transcriptional regulator n=1 Tax=Nocardia gamkensis TaxID=352869 RepID=UPI0036E205B9
MPEVEKAAQEVGAAETQPLSAVETAGDVPRGDLFGLAEAFADLVGGPIILEDANFRVLSYSSFTGHVDAGRNAAILGRRIPPEWLAYLEQTGSLETLRSTYDVVDLPSGPWQAHRRLITAVRTEARLLGIIWAAEGTIPLPVHALDALRQAASIAVPHLLRYEEQHRSQRHRRGELVRSLLEGRGQLHRHVDELGLPRAADFAVLAFAPSDGTEVTEEQWDRITDHVALSCEAFRWKAAVARIGGAVFAVLAVSSGPAGVLRLGQEIVTRSVPTLRGNLCGSLSTIGPKLSSINIRRVQAADALAVVQARPSAKTRFTPFEAVQAEVILRELSQILNERTDLRLPGLDALAAEDNRKGSQFLHTLSVFLAAGAHYSEAANSLGLHVTTLRYRIKRIAEISGLDLGNPTVRLVCELLLTTQSDG